MPAARVGGVKKTALIKDTARLALTVNGTPASEAEPASHLTPHLHH